MSELIHQFISIQAQRKPEATALKHKDLEFSYAELEQQVVNAAQGLRGLGLQTGDRVATYLPKLPEMVFTVFGASAAGGVFVPINPLLKPAQVAYILQNCNVRILVTSSQRLTQLAEVLLECPELAVCAVVEDDIPELAHCRQQLQSWRELTDQTESAVPTGAGSVRRIDADMAAILYTSGSTGSPKGVVLSHRNLVIGAKSVASYLHNTPEDCILAVLPFSFDAGLSQLTTAFHSGASVVLMDYLLPRDVIRAVVKYGITGLGAVPPLWNQLADLEWPRAAARSMRYITNTGGAMPTTTTSKLRAALPGTLVYLMYGLTEAFRSTYLPPEQVAIRPESMGKAIPNAEVQVVRSDGTECEPGEPGELVHRGSLVAMGYWNDPETTAQRFKPAPGQPAELPLTEIAVWSGDEVKKDAEGYLYFVSRMDEMIKSSGYRVSATEVEEVLYASGLVKAVAALGLPP
ncbi:MAG: acyl-CoA ligase (AMP-forming), exosortase A system-associated, partial [Gammaproteobacteria bacterium]|nr:acyl-CoA ligase (AMP-forming), exosortase A system-associated [Gammaproteobacteria bacterium]